MKSTWLLLVGIAIGMLGMGTYISTSKPSQESSEDSATSSSNSRSKLNRGGTRSHFPIWSPKPGNGSKTVSEKESITSDLTEKPESSQATEPAETENPPLITNLPRPIDGELTREELVLRAERIQARANRELDRLTKLLDLSVEQQDRIFPLLAQSSTAYHPSLAIQVGDAEAKNPTKIADAESKSEDPGTAEKPPVESNEVLLAKEAEEEIHDILTDEQQVALQDEIVDADLWWTDIVNDLEDELDESTEIAADEDTSYEGNAGLSNLLQQAAEAAASGNE